MISKTVSVRISDHILKLIRDRARIDGQSIRIKIERLVLSALQSLDIKK